MLLVDGDVAKPHMSRLFGVDKEPGLLDVLADPDLDIEIGDPADRHSATEPPARRDAVRNRDRVAGERAHGGRSSQQLANSIRSGIVLFDSLPILLTSESRVLDHAGGPDRAGRQGGRDAAAGGDGRHRDASATAKNISSRAEPGRADRAAGLLLRLSLRVSVVERAAQVGAGATQPESTTPAVENEIGES